MKEQELFPFGPLMAVGLCIVIGLLFVYARETNPHFQPRPAASIELTRARVALMAPETPEQTNAALTWITNTTSGR